MIGRCVAYRKTDETDLCWSIAVKTGVLFIGRGVAYRKTGPHGILFISTVDLLQPPRATVDLLHPPRAPVHPASASTARYSTGYCSTTPPSSTVHPALHTTGSCSTTPPPSTVHPALHTTRSCSSTPPRAPLHRLLFIHPSTTPRCPVHPEATPPLTVHPTPPPQRSLFIPSIGFS